MKFLHRMRLDTMLRLTIGAAFIAAAVLLIVLINQQMRAQALKEAEHKAIILLDRNLATHTYFSKQLKPSVFPIVDSSTKIPKSYFMPSWMSSTYAVREIDKYFQDLNQANYYFKEAAINARSPQNEADDFERAFLRELQANPELNQRSLIRYIEGAPYYVTIRRGEVMEESCLSCHSAPEEAPGDLVEEYGPDRSFNRKVGDVISAISIRIPLADAYAQANQFSLRLSLYMLGIIAALFMAQQLTIRYFLLKPILEIGEKAGQIAANPHKIGEVIAVEAGRELQALAGALNTMSKSLHNYQKNLENQVADRTADLRQINQKLEAELAHSREMEQELILRQEQLEATNASLDRSNQELDQFAYVVSHDLKAPLRGIKNLAAWLEEEIGPDLGEEARKYLELLKDRVGRMELLIQGILQYSRVTRLHENSEKVEVAGLLEEILQEMAIPSDFKVEIGPGMPVITTSKIKLRQVFANLLENAVRYHHSPNGRIQVWVDDAEEFYKFSVTDDGPGIAIQYHDKIFEIFQTLHPKEGNGGTGVGLALVKKIVENYGGKITLESTEGQGAKFIFTWPKGI